MSFSPSTHLSDTPSATLLRDLRTISLLLAGTLVIMAVPTISPALAGLEARFGHEPHAALMTRLLVPAPSLVVVLSAPVIGYLADRTGKSRMLLLGTLLIAIAGTAGLYLPSLSLILASRFVLGIGVAMIMTSQIALIGDCFEGEARAKIMGWQISARNFGGMIFVSLGGVFAGFDPQLPFAIFTIALIYAPVIWIAFGMAGEQGEEAMPQAGMMASLNEGWFLPALALSGFMMLTVGVFFQMPTQLPFFVVSRGFDSASITGGAMAALTLAGALAALATASLKRSPGVAGLFALGYLAMGAGFGTLSVDAGLPFLLLGAILIGVGYAILTPAFTGLLLQLVPADRRGSASGMLTTGGFIGQFVSPLVATPLIATFGYGTVFLTSGGLLLILGLGALLMGKVAVAVRSS
ncbi:MAG: MFS transporter [Roseibium sp.]|uniref:MFS transporter n=1 Tax=Roseibium sp. TaxID=1936156 RepID=UPI003266467D